MRNRPLAPLISSMFFLALLGLKIQGFSQPNPIRLSWKLKKEFVFKEIKATKAAEAGWKPVPKKGEKLYRYIADAEYNFLSQYDFENYSRSWEAFYKSADTTGLRDSDLRKQYSEFLKTHDPNLKIRIHVLSPQLQFSFSSNSADSLYLQSITIKTIAYKSYLGGGFCGESEWNDIVLSHKNGVKEYDLRNRFSFLKSGTLDLRFFSDYFSRQVGFAPLGNYLIQIQFNFLGNGKTETASTEVFKIDA